MCLVPKSSINYTHPVERDDNLAQMIQEATNIQRSSCLCKHVVMTSSAITTSLTTYQDGLNPARCVLYLHVNLQTSHVGYPLLSNYRRLEVAG